MKNSKRTKNLKWHNMARFKDIASRCDVKTKLAIRRKRIGRNFLHRNFGLG